MDYNFDKSKLIYHPGRVEEWLRKGNVFPVYMEISPTDKCNHNCIFCAFDFAHGMHYIDYGKYERFIIAAGSNGLKAVMFGGEGEPFMNNSLYYIVKAAKDSNVDVAITTNGSINNNIDLILPQLSWIKVSLDAHDGDLYQDIHGVGWGEFEIVTQNMKEMVSIRNNGRYKCKIGIQCTVIENNFQHLKEIAELGKRLGVDYCVFKAYSQHYLSHNKLDNCGLNYYTEDEMNSASTDKYKVIYRHAVIDKKKKSYDKCHSLSFWAFMTSQGDIYNCSSWIGNEQFLMGKDYKWFLDYKYSDIDVHCNQCRDNCRMDSNNEYLYRLLHSDEHDNFI